LAPVTGELVADLALGRPPRVDAAAYSVGAGSDPPGSAADTIQR
jgi:glycine/D-amino acid oxidase-like deaminating enzyme